MKKITAIIATLIILMASNLWAAGSCTESVADYTGGPVVVALACTGSADDGSIPNTALSAATMKLLEGKYFLYTVSAYPTAGGTAPDAADVFILDANGEDLLGSADGGTTANKGANLIHATLKKTVRPYCYQCSGEHYFRILNTLTAKVTGQATHSANYTLELVFER